MSRDKVVHLLTLSRAANCSSLKSPTLPECIFEKQNETIISKVAYLWVIFRLEHVNNNVDSTDIQQQIVFLKGLSELQLSNDLIDCIKWQRRNQGETSRSITVNEKDIWKFPKLLEFREYFFSFIWQQLRDRVFVNKTHVPGSRI